MFFFLKHLLHKIKDREMLDVYILLKHMFSVVFLLQRESVSIAPQLAVSIKQMSL